MRSSLFDPAKSLAIVVGAKEWPSLKNFSASQAYESTAEGIKNYLTDLRGLSLPSENVLDLFNSEKSSESQLDEMHDWLQARLGVLEAKRGSGITVFFFYVGHGAFFGINNEYCLLLRQSREPHVITTSLRVEDVAQILKLCAPNSARIILLDCCFAGAAIKYFQGATTQLERLKISEILSQPDSAGVAVFCASNARNPTRLSSTAGATAFGYALLEVLRKGDPTWEGRLSLQKVCELTQVEVRSIDKSLRPELHSPDQRAVSLELRPIFPNSAEFGISTLQPFIPQPNRKMKILSACAVVAIVAVSATSGSIWWNVRNEAKVNAGAALWMVAATKPLGEQGAVPPGPERMAIDSQANTGYVMNYGASTVTAYNLNSLQVKATIPVGMTPADIVIDPIAHRAYISSWNDSYITVISTLTNETVHTIPLDGPPSGLAFDAQSRRVYVTTSASQLVAIDSTTDAKVGNPLEMPASPAGIAIDSSRHIIYVAIGTGVAFVDTRTPTVVNKFPLPGLIKNIAVDPDSGRIYATNELGDANGQVYVISPSPGHDILNKVDVGRGPDAIVVDPEVHAAYAMNFFDGTVAVIDTRRDSLERTVPVGGTPWGAALDPKSHQLYVPDGRELVVVLADGKPSLPISSPDIQSMMAAFPSSLHSNIVNCQELSIPNANGIPVNCIMSSAGALLDGLRFSTQSPELEAMWAPNGIDTDKFQKVCQGSQITVKSSGTGCSSGGHGFQFYSAKLGIIFTITELLDDEAFSKFLDRSGLAS